MENDPQSIQAVREVLRKFQEGYAQRNPDHLDAFMQLFTPDNDLEIVGTGAIRFGQDEWCLGPEMARELVDSDWRYWGDVRLDLENAHIHALGQVAWLATPGTVTMQMDTQESYRDYVDYVAEIARREDLLPQDKVMEIMRGSSNTIFEQSRGETFIWPFRFTAVRD